MRKVDNEEKKKRKKEKIMSFIVATNVIACRLPERRSTGIPYAHAKILEEQGKNGQNLRGLLSSKMTAFIKGLKISQILF